MASQIDWEVIVVDDNSPDGTLEVAEQLQRLYGPHRIVRAPPSIYKAHDHRQIPKPRIFRIYIYIYMNGTLMPEIGLPFLFVDDIDVHKVDSST
jgi:glycosyltransferase involved in cell wall biosynthesis